MACRRSGVQFSLAPRIDTSKVSEIGDQNPVPQGAGFSVSGAISSVLGLTRRHVTEEARVTASPASRGVGRTGRRGPGFLPGGAGRPLHGGEGRRCAAVRGGGARPYEALARAGAGPVPFRAPQPCSRRRTPGEGRSAPTATPSGHPARPADRLRGLRPFFCGELESPGPLGRINLRTRSPCACTRRPATATSGAVSGLVRRRR